MTCLSETMIFPIAAMQLLHTWFHARLAQQILNGILHVCVKLKVSTFQKQFYLFSPHRRRFFTPTVVLLSFNKPDTVLWTIAKILLLYIII